MLLKNQIDHGFVQALAQRLAFNCKSFSSKTFENSLMSLDWSSLELKQRVRAISQAFGQMIPGGYDDQIKVLQKVAPNTQGLGAMVFPDFVEVYGMGHWETSMRALEFFTPIFSAEFAVRPFIVKDPDRMMATLQVWSKSENHHVRRLASEGCRPRLPWSFPLKSFVVDPSPLFPILEHLKQDPSPYVRKSVANNLNDISKDHPEKVIQIAKSWIGKNAHTDGVIKHALRTLLKRADPRALQIFELKKPDGISLFKLKTALDCFTIGSTLQFSFDLQNTTPTEKFLRGEYIVHYRKKSGDTSKKVFKLFERDFPARSTQTISRRHSLRQMTTRKHYPGKHILEVAINGVVLAQTNFDLK